MQEETREYLKDEELGELYSIQESIKKASRLFDISYCSKNTDIEKKSIFGNGLDFSKEKGKLTFIVNLQD